jgi:hypothetical protein
MITLGKKLINVDEILLVEIIIKYPKYDQLYGCILITFKNSITTEILKTEKGYPEHLESTKVKEELLTEMEREFGITTRLINTALGN